MNYSSQLTLAKEFVEEEENSATNQAFRIYPRNFTFHIGFSDLEELRDKKLIQINGQQYIPKKEKAFQEIFFNFICWWPEPDRFIDAYVIEDSSAFLKVGLDWFGWDPEEKMHYLISAEDFISIKVEQ